MPSTGSLKRDLLGYWRLLSRVDLDATGKRHIDPFLGAEPIGFLTFGTEWFAAQFMKVDRSAAPPPPSSTVSGTANNTSAVGGYDAYFGTYEVDVAASSIRTTLVGALTAANVGQTFTRQVGVAGNTLTITLTTNSASGVHVTRTLTFERVQ